LMCLKIRSAQYLLVLGISVTANAALARFVETDADKIDQEERYNTETYNDKFSYRYPADWQRVYEKSDAAVRLNAGSLNADRFDYYDDVKLHAANDTAGFQFNQSRQEDVLEQVTLREVRASGFFDSGIYVSMVADGGSFKEYGDVGWALGYGDVGKPVVEILYWSVDHFYDTKKSDTADSRLDQAWTLALKSNVSLSEGLLLTVAAEYDNPLTWIRPSRGYTYKYEQRNLKLKAAYQLSNHQTLTLDLSTASKKEAKAWDLLKYEKSMARQVNISEIKWSQISGQAINEIGLGYVDRRANYTHVVDLSNPDQELPEPMSPESSKRDESVLWATRYTPWIAERHFMQYGLFINYVNLKESRHDLVAESKLQWAWEYRYLASARVVLNTTWDINQLTDDFPYKKRPFRPWGGGNIQFIAAL